MFSPIDGASEIGATEEFTLKSIAEEGALGKRLAEVAVGFGDEEEGTLDKRLAEAIVGAGSEEDKVATPKEDEDEEVATMKEDEEDEVATPKEDEDEEVATPKGVVDTLSTGVPAEGKTVGLVVAVIK